MTTTTNYILIGLLGVLLGAGGAFLALDERREPGSRGLETKGGAMSHGSMGMQDEMGGMMRALDGKTGDAFDQAFLSEMVVHHQGAVAMAEAALKHAKHQEILDLAEAIISAQNSEIEEMQGWQKTWYGQ